VQVTSEPEEDIKFIIADMFPVILEFSACASALSPWLPACDTCNSQHRGSGQYLWTSEGMVREELPAASLVIVAVCPVALLERTRADLA